MRTQQERRVDEAEAGGRLAELYALHSAEAIRLAYMLTGDRMLAEDLVQDAFVKLAGRLTHLRDPGAFDPYLRRTVINLANSAFRRKRLERAYLRRSVAEPVDAEDPPGSGRDDEIWSGLQRLPARQRTAIVLRFYGDMPELRIAEILGCRPGTVRSLLSRGLAELRLHVRSDIDG
ncbi:MAG: SigE family RNA polymerase sigma factor [Actinomycetota bacterium]